MENQNEVIMDTDMFKEEAVSNVAMYSPSSMIKALSEQASSVNVDPDIPAVRYLRGSVELMRMARVYLSEGNLESAFVLYQKYLSLILEKLPAHPGFPKTDPNMKKSANKQCKEAMEIAEKIKAKLKSKYEVDFKEKLIAEQERLRKLHIEQQKKQEEERQLREMQEAQQRVQADARKKQAAEDEDRKFALYLQNELDKEARNEVTPTAPPQPAVQSVPSEPAHPPEYGEVSPSPQSQNEHPAVDRSTKPAHFTQTSTDLSTSQFGLKTVIVPASLAKTFADLATENTSKQIETCGVLFGKLTRGSFILTHVVVPKQNGAPDSCDMFGEEDIFKFHDENDVIQLGWIHTHPTQTAFLSSVDLHTHASYQNLMPEAIAIVVAPKHDEVGIFQLTPSYGLDYINKCSASGFHPHPSVEPIFSECAHVKVDSSIHAQFVDLRR